MIKIQPCIVVEFNFILNWIYIILLNASGKCVRCNCSNSTEKNTENIKLNTINVNNRRHWRVKCAREEKNFLAILIRIGFLLLFLLL